MATKTEHPLYLFQALDNSSRGGEDGQVGDEEEQLCGDVMNNCVGRKNSCAGTWRTAVWRGDEEEHPCGDRKPAVW